MDRPPPQDLDSERAVLGACMLGGPGVMDDVLPIIRAEMFFLNPHRDIWRALVETHERGDPMDLMVVENELKQRKKLSEIGGQEYLIVLAESFGDTANGSYYARLIRDHHRRRSLISIGLTLANTGHETARAPEQVAGEVVSQLESLISENDGVVCNAVDLLRRLPEHLAEKSTSFVKTGLVHRHVSIDG